MYGATFQIPTKNFKIYNNCILLYITTSGYAAARHNSREPTVTLHIPPVYPTARRQMSEAHKSPTVASR